MNFISNNKTKIIATYGPACERDEVFESMIRNGVDVFRFNFSHGDYDFHQKGFQKVKDFNKIHGTHIAILADLQGPKIRVGDVEDGGIELVKNQEIILSNIKQVSNLGILYVSYERLGLDVQVGEEILVDDGKIKLQATSIVDENHIKVVVLAGGELKSKKRRQFSEYENEYQIIDRKG